MCKPTRPRAGKGGLVKGFQGHPDHEEDRRLCHDGGARCSMGLAGGPPAVVHVRAYHYWVEDAGSLPAPSVYAETSKKSTLVVHLLSAFLRAKDPIDKRERSEFLQ